MFKNKYLLIIVLIAVLLVGMKAFPQIINAAPTNQPIPGQIEAESYTAMSGIQTETCSEGGQDVGWTDAGDWMDYSVNVSTTGTYSVDFRLTSPYANTQLQLKSGATVLATITVPNTGGWQAWATVTSTNVSLTAGSQTLRIYAVTNGWNFNWMKFTLNGGPTATPTPTSAATATPTPTRTATATPTPAPGANLALNKAVTVSSTENGGTPGSAAVDGNTGTRWSSAASDPQWIYVDLGASCTVNRVVLRWEVAYGKSYTIQVSANATSWTNVYSTTTGDGGVDDISFTATSARYVRMYGTVRATGYGYSLWEFEVYGSAGPTPTPGPTATSTPTPTVGPTSTPVPTPTIGPTPTPGGPVDFGPNVHIYDPGMSMTTIQSELDTIWNAQQNNQFGDRRDAILLKPGTYSINVGVGFYTEVMGLGANPDATTTNGVYSVAYLSGNNATCNFWRGITNFKVNSTSSQWAVSQAIWFRQMHVTGRLQLHQGYGWASGGWIANSKIDGQCEWGSQQQFIIRNSQSGSYAGGAWNFVYVGVPGAPATTFPSPPNTTIATVPVVREKPFLMFDGSSWSVRVPSLKTNSSGYDWGGGSVPGTTIPIGQFFIAKPSDSAATINSQLAAGKNLILTPGIYNIDQTIQVNRANTIVLGMGFATLRPTNGVISMTVGDVDGVTIAGVLFDAGTTNSPIQLRAGTAGNTTSHASNPIVLQDVIFRVGGAYAGKTTTSVEINAYDTIVDHTWVWRADHGAGVGWTSNTANNGVVVNGNNVICYGLFVEHYQQYQTLWNGQNGKVYFYQSEDPYDPPNQASWTSGSGVNGWASYKVSNNVTSHEAWGLGIYSVFTNTGVNQTRAMEVVVNPNVKFHSMVIENLNQGTIQYVINNTAGPTVVSFP